MVNKVEDGYMRQIMTTLRAGEFRQYQLEDVNPQSWRTVASRLNKEAGYVKYSIVESKKLGTMAVKCNK